MILLRSSRSSFCPKGALSRLLACLRLIIHPSTSRGEADAPSSTPSVHDQSGSLPSESYKSPPIDPAILREHLLGFVRQLQSALPGGCVLEAAALKVIGKHPIDAGGVADIWEGAMGNCKVAVKSLRHSLSSDYSKICTVSGAYLQGFPVPEVYWQRFNNEILACGYLVHPNVVPFIGVYSTPEHPFGLVFEYMEDRNLKEYLRNNEDVRRHELVRFDRHNPCSSH
jgi:serine/threonine protein kinase